MQTSPVMTLVAASAVVTQSAIERPAAHAGTRADNRLHVILLQSDANWQFQPTTATGLHMAVQTAPYGTY